MPDNSKTGISHTTNKTIPPNQEHLAKIIKIGEILVENIPPKRAGEPNIRVRGEVTNRDKLLFTVEIEGKILTQKEIDISRYIRIDKTKPLLLLIAVLLVAILIGTVAFPIRETTRDKKTDNGVTKITISPIQTPTEKTTPTQTAPTVTFPVTPHEKNKNTGDTNKQELKTEQIPQTTNKKTQIVPEAPAKDTITLYFPPDSYKLTTKAKEKLNSLIPTLNRITDTQVAIYGHCALYRTERGRIKLSQQRAITVYKYLIKRGWKPEVKPEIKGFGGKKPLTKDPKKQYLNRRVEIILKGKKSSNNK